MPNETLPIKKNKILAALPPHVFKRLLPHLESVRLVHGEILHEIGKPVEYVYFPYNAMISLVLQMTNGKIVEGALIGNNGMAGIEALLGEEIASKRAIVQIANGGCRAKLSVIKKEFMRGEELQALLLSYARDLMRQVAQTSACNTTHSSVKRLSRWLLLCHDGVGGDVLGLTQEFMSQMLSTRRATVSVAATALQTQGLIKYSRGIVKIIDRPRLEAFTCECYGALNNSKALPRH